MSHFRSLFLLALCLAAASALAQPAAVEVRVENPLDQPRPDEVVELDWSELQSRLPQLAEGNVRVIDAGSGDEVLTQVFDGDGDGAPEALLFLASLWPSETHTYTVEATPPAADLAPRSYARYDPPRDDMAWESDRIAFRTYGQGLWENDEYGPLVSSGIDVWPKRTRDLILDRWYEKGHDAYHLDTGEGADFFSVGPTLGAGGTAIWHDGTLHRAENFAGHRILADGPIRAVFEMTYEPWDAGGVEVSETKRITVDAGQNLFHSESTFETDGADELTVAVGFVKRAEGLVGSMKQATPNWAWLSAWGPVERKNGGHGDLGTAALLDRSRLEEVRETDDHYLALLTATPGEPIVHYAGAGWTASGDFDSVQDWWAHLDALAQRLQHPVRVTLSPATP
jgi:pectinesterase